MPDADGNPTPAEIAAEKAAEIAEAVAAAARLEQIERQNAARRQAEQN